MLNTEHSGLTELPERLALKELQRGLRQLNTRLGRRDPMPRLRFDLRGRSAGQARLQEWSIRLNPTLLHQHGVDFIRDTVPHELAHLIAFAQYGGRIRPHGEEWRHLMRLLGRPATVCHDYEVKPARQLRRFDYHCGCRPHQLSSIRHRRCLQGMRYLCRHCGGELRAD